MSTDEFSEDSHQQSRKSFLNYRRISKQALISLTLTRKSYSETVQTFKTQLEADLATGMRGGRKAKLIAKSWIAIHQGQSILDEYDYQSFRAKWMNRTMFDIKQCLSARVEVPESQSQQTNSQFLRQ